MKGTPEEVLKAIPDYTDLLSLAQTISGLMYRKLSLEAQIKEGESLVFRTANTDEKYFQNGKPPASTFVDNTYKYPGLAGELLPLRTELARVIAELEGKRLELDIYKTMIEVWRTLSSNSRSVAL